MEQTGKGSRKDLFSLILGILKVLPVVIYRIVAGGKGEKQIQRHFLVSLGSVYLYRNLIFTIKEVRRWQT